MKLTKLNKLIIQRFIEGGAIDLDEIEMRPEDFADFINTEIRHYGADFDSYIYDEFKYGLEEKKAGNNEYQDELFEEIYKKHKTIEEFEDLIEATFCHKDFDFGFDELVQDYLPSTIYRLLKAVGKYRGEI